MIASKYMYCTVYSHTVESKCSDCYCCCCRFFLLMEINQSHAHNHYCVIIIIINAHYELMMQVVSETTIYNDDYVRKKDKKSSETTWPMFVWLIQQEKHKHSDRTCAINRICHSDQYKLIELANVLDERLSNICSLFQLIN